MVTELTNVFFPPFAASYLALSKFLTRTDLWFSKSHGKCPWSLFLFGYRPETTHACQDCKLTPWALGAQDELQSNVLASLGGG